MLKRIIGPLVFGLGGLAVLISLGLWQVSRLEWKLEIIADIESRIHATPVAIPDTLSPDDHRYLPVFASGSYTGEAVHVLSSQRERGTGTRVIAVLQAADGRRLLVDRGFMSDAVRDGADLTAQSADILGNLQWPNDSDSYTPEPDLNRGLWFSRNVDPIATHLGTEPVMIVARTDTPAVPGLVPTPINTAEIKNDHLGYAFTWFSLALVWAVMTVFLLWRIRRNTA